MLYQYATARDACRQIRQVVVVEGYMDLLAFHAQGFHRVAATLGTALTPQQVRLLRRIADEVVLLYDADQAGEKAMTRAAPLFFQEQLSVACLQLPEGMDPDDFLRAKGLSEFERLMQRRQNLSTFVIGKTLDGWDGTSSGKTKVLAELQPLYLSILQPVLRAECLRLIAGRLSLSEKVIEQQLSRSGPASGKHSASFKAAPLSDCSQTQSPEESILRMMVKYPPLIEDVKASGGAKYFQQTQLRAIAEALMQTTYPPQGEFDASAAYESLPGQDLKELFTRILMEWDSYGDLERARLLLHDRLGALLKREERKKPPSLREALRKAEQEGDAERVRQLLEQIQDLHSPKRKISDRPENV
jgi:DNA primase